MFFKRTDNLTTNLTSYDFLKSITVFFMIIDHIGFFFFPDQLWLRVIGRMGFPAWFFLAGYSKNHEIGQTLWLGAALLIFGNIAFGQYIFPANALVSYICIQLFISKFYGKIFSNSWILTTAVIFFFILSFPTGMAFEYGTLVFLLAMLGYAVRHKDDVKVSKDALFIFSAFVILLTTVWQIFTFGFSKYQSIVCLIEMVIIGVVLCRFKSAEYPKLTEKLPSFFTNVIQFGGRYTLEIYVFHLLVIKAYLLYADYGHYKWFSPTYLMNFPAVQP